MLRIYIVIAALATALCANAHSWLTVVDASDRSPITGATVIDKSGIIVGITDNLGKLRITGNIFPISIRCIGYETATIPSDSTIVQLVPTNYNLDEFVVTPHDRPIKRVLSFAREYSSGISGSDTMQYYCEYMTEAFIVDGKVKGYSKSDARPCPKGVKRYARISKNGVDSIFKPKRGDDITELSWFDFLAFLPEKIEVPESLKNGAESDTVHGKYGPQFILRKKNGLFTKTADVLSGHKNRKWSPFIFKILGMTVDIDAGQWTLTFADRGSTTVGLHDFVCGTYHIHLIGKGKWIRKIFNSKHPIEMNSYIELYPVEITNCSVSEYKELKDDFSPIPFHYPNDLTILSPTIAKLINRIDSEATIYQ